MSTRALTAVVKDVHDSGPGGWTAVVSAPTVDRDDEVVEARCFEPCPASVPVRDGHFGGTLVGSGRPYYRGAELWLDGRFARTERAQEVRALVIDGHLSAMSVVFLPLADKHVAGRRHITKGELLAVDFVDIASNRDARVLAARGYGGSMSVADARRMANQALVDLASLDLGEARAAAPDPALRTPTDLRRYASEIRSFLKEK